MKSDKDFFREFLSESGFNLKAEWFHATVNRSKRTSDWKNWLGSQLLYTDLRESSLPVLPTKDFTTTQQNCILQGKYVLQVVDITNIGESAEFRQKQSNKRQIKMCLTDGLSYVYAVEYRRIASFNMHIKPGSKLLIEDALVLAPLGVVLLTHETCFFLGQCENPAFEKLGQKDGIIAVDNLSVRSFTGGMNEVNSEEVKHSLVEKENNIEAPQFPVNASKNRAVHIRNQNQEKDRNTAAINDFEHKPLTHSTINLTDDPRTFAVNQNISLVQDVNRNMPASKEPRNEVASPIDPSIHHLFFTPPSQKNGSLKLGSNAKSSNLNNYSNNLTNKLAIRKGESDVMNPYLPYVSIWYFKQHILKTNTQSFLLKGYVKSVISFNYKNYDLYVGIEDGSSEQTLTAQVHHNFVESLMGVPCKTFTDAMGNSNLNTTNNTDDASRWASNMQFSLRNLEGIFKLIVDRSCSTEKVILTDCRDYSLSDTQLLLHRVQRMV